MCRGPHQNFINQSEGKSEKTLKMCLIQLWGWYPACFQHWYKWRYMGVTSSIIYVIFATTTSTRISLIYLWKKSSRRGSWEFETVEGIWVSCFCWNTHGTEWKDEKNCLNHLDIIHYAQNALANMFVKWTFKNTRGRLKFNFSQKPIIVQTWE